AGVMASSVALIESIPGARSTDDRDVPIPTTMRPGGREYAGGRSLNAEPLLDRGSTLASILDDDRQGELSRGILRHRPIEDRIPVVDQLPLPGLDGGPRDTSPGSERERHRLQPRPPEAARHEPESIPGPQLAHRRVEVRIVRDVEITVLLLELDQAGR